MLVFDKKRQKKSLTVKICIYIVCIMKRTLHIVKMRNKSIAVLMMAGLMMGFSGFGLESAAAKTSNLSQVRKDLNEGDLYQARKKAQKILEKDQTNAEAQKLMAEIIDREIARHKEIMTGSAKEELPADAKEEEVKTWLERAQSLMALKRYNEAVLAVEKAFSYDPENRKASKLMDEIKTRALRDGEQEVLVRQEVARGEIKDRVDVYVEQAQEYIKAGRWGGARMTVDKILLLQPDNKRALKLQKKIIAHNEKTAAAQTSEKTESLKTPESPKSQEGRSSEAGTENSGAAAVPTEVR